MEMENTITGSQTQMLISCTQRQRGLVSIGNRRFEQLQTSSRQTIQKLTAGMSPQAQIKMIYTDIKKLFMHKLYQVIDLVRKGVNPPQV